MTPAGKLPVAPGTKWRIQNSDQRLADSTMPMADSEFAAGAVGLRRLAVAGAACTLALVFVGGSVTSNDAGMAVPDWPTTFGQNLFLYPPAQWVGDVLFEHTHRLLGAAVGVVMIATAVWSHYRERRGAVRVLAWSLLGAVVVQGVMGGLRVTENNVGLAIVHGCTAQLFFCATACLVLVTSRSWGEVSLADTAVPAGLKRFCLVTSVVVFGQSVLGAIYRHLGWGLAYHVMGAVVVTFLVSGLLLWVNGHYGHVRLLRRLTGVLAAVFIVQLALGLGAYVTTMSYDPSRAATLLEWFVPSLHVACGACVLAISVAVTVSVMVVGAGVAAVRADASLGKVSPA